MTLPYRVVVRAKLVLWAADGHTNREIGARVDMCADRVAGWRKRFAAEGPESARFTVTQHPRSALRALHSASETPAGGALSAGATRG